VPLLSPRVQSTHATTTSEFNALYLAHFRTVSDTAHRIIGVRALADEIAQDVLLGAWQSFDAYDSTLGSVGTYLRLIARRRAIDCLRSEMARSRRQLRLVPNQRDATEGQTAALGGIEQRLVWDALAKLPRNQRQPIVLAFFGGMRYRAIATHLDLPEGTVKSRIRTGMQALAVQLQSAAIHASH
jgi:RNA polymerase sigma-70 factor, ECF subfamily